MNTEQMIRTIMEIEEQLMFSHSECNYRDLLDAVEELRYFLLYDVGIQPTEIELDMIANTEQEYIF